MRIVLSIIGILLFMTSCQSGKSGSDKKGAGVHEVIVKEVLQAGQYTYLKVTEGDAELWLAVTAMQAEVGKTYYYKDGMEMKDFHSKELNRNFATVYFINEISTDPEMKSTTQQVSPHGQMGGTDNQGAMDGHGAMGGHGGMQDAKPKIEKQDVKVSPAAGGITIGTLYAKKTDYSGKIVKIKGKVVKFSPDIMGKNWMHIQDGTESMGDFDLTVNTMATVKVGDIVTIEGKVALDKDFGAGYIYNVIVEDASVK